MSSEFEKNLINKLYPIIKKTNRAKDLKDFKSVLKFIDNEINLKLNRKAIK